MDRMAVQLRELVVATDEYRRVEAAALGVGLPEAAALGELYHRGPLPPSALVTRLGIASASVTALVDRLTVAGLLERQPHPTDRRSVLVVLTDRGRSAIAGIVSMFTEDILRAIEDARPEHVREFTGTLAGIAASLRARAADRDTVARDVHSRVRPADPAPAPRP